jgi:hypothetical protein
VSIGRGQGDENRIKRVEHEKEKEEETILRGTNNSAHCSAFNHTGTEVAAETARRAGGGGVLLWEDREKGEVGMESE